MTTSIAAISARNLSRQLADRTLLADVSFAVQPGQVLAILGPSGSGKTSLLRLLNRLDEPTGGTVELNGQDYRELAPCELRRQVGMVAQRAWLFPGNVADNVAFGPRQQQRSFSVAETRGLLAQVGLEGYEDRDTTTLSGGEAQRAAIARALANRPAVLLLDEPTSALDDASKHGIEELLARIIAERSLTCVWITHDLQQAARMADLALRLHAGHVTGFGPAKEMLRV